ncbi:MAG: ABC transporter permease [Candidatus Aminicenantes bacterium]|nr:ABC transporter permease [Candidatus Aminicenantes bacterium]
MFDLEREIRHWKKELWKNEALEDGTIAEVESHLREEIDSLCALGWSAASAFKRAVDLIGKIQPIGGEYHKINTRRRTGRPPWRSPFMMPDLLWNIFKITLRRIKRHKGYSLINISGLAIGLTCCILIFLWVQRELSFDRFHANADRIYRVLSVWPEDSEYGPQGPGPLGPTLKSEYPDIVNVARLFDSPSRPLRHEDTVFHIKTLGVDPSFLEIFSFPFIRGDLTSSFEDPKFIVLTEETAKKYFGEEDPTGKILMFEWWGRWLEFHVTGVVKNVPQDSHLQFDALIPFDFVTASGMTIDQWDTIAYHTYVQLDTNADYEALDTKISEIIKKYSPSATHEFHLEPLTRIHLHNYFGGGPISYVYIFSTIGILILLIACINFMNLSTARSMSRAKEVGMRKVVGSSRGQLIQQFLGESVVLSLLALCVAVIFVQLLLPSVNRILETKLSMHLNPIVLILLFGIALTTGLISGCYPAFLLSGFQPVAAITGSGRKTSKRSPLRRILVISQFVITIALIICVTFVFKQLSFIRNKGLGFQKSQILSLTMGGSYWDNYETIKQEMLSNPNVLSMTQTNFSFPSGFGTSHLWWEGKENDENISMDIRSVDFDFQKTFGIEMAQGRFFSENFQTDVLESFILNEAAVKFLGLESPVNKAFSCQIPFADGKGKIIGVVKDFHFQSLHREIAPLILMIHPYWFTHCHFRISPEDVPETFAFINLKLKELVPEYPFELRFLDDNIDGLYKMEQRVGHLVRYGAIIAVFVACLGLFGLASFTTEQRTKEIGIRKVLGASVPGVLYLFSREFTKWVLLANVIAWPVAYLVMRRWLHGFAYRTPMEWDVFVFSAALALLTACLTVAYHSIKAAVSNPVNSLRHE